jgi:hypothetical protein
MYFDATGHQRQKYLSRQSTKASNKQTNDTFEEEDKLPWA